MYRTLRTIALENKNYTIGTLPVPMVIEYRELTKY